MLVTQSSQGKPIVVLGNMTFVANCYVDLKSAQKVLSYDLDASKALTELNRLLSENPDKWGECETDWDDALNGDTVMRTLLAMNGKYLNILMRDENSDVRAAVAEACFERLRNKPCEESNDIYYLAIIEQMFAECMDDDGVSVAFVIAAEGEERHLKLLASHPFYLIRLRVASYTQSTRLLSQLSTDESYLVRHSVALNSRTPKKVLAKLADDIKAFVREAAKPTAAA